MVNFLDHLAFIMEIVLYSPQIPQNAGNILRTCSVTASSLALIHPLGFKTTDRYLKRAGLDYWEGVSVSEWPSFEIFLQARQNLPLFFFSSKTKQVYTEASYPKDALLVFGSETSGLPTSLHETYLENFYTLPMLEGKRCLNLASSAAIVLYEALRQQGFPQLKP